MPLASNPVIAFIATTSFDRARAFYVDRLGLEFIENDNFAIVLRSGPVTIRVVKVDNFTAAQFTILGWQVDDIRTTVADLQAKGIVFERYGYFEQDDLAIWTSPNGGKVAWFKDPDGNVLSLSQHSTA